MGDKTGIEWTDSTWSPIRFRVKTDAAEIARAKGYTSLVQIAEKMVGHVGSHCEHVSPGCEHCYAESNNHRCLPANGTGLPYDRRSRDLLEPLIDEKVLLQPLKWGTKLELNATCPNNRIAGVHGIGAADCICRQRPRRIFVENQSDLFGEWVTDEMLDRVFALMALCPQHTFQVLTKRPDRAVQYFLPKQFQQANGRNQMRLFHISTAIGALAKKDPRAQNMEPQAQVTVFEGGPLPNVWLGVSVENQAAASERIPLLLKTPAAVRFISAEPLLGPVDLKRVFYRDHEDPEIECLWNTLTAYHEVLHSNSMDIVATADDGVTKLDWVIVGGESGSGARSMHMDWARKLRAQCTAAKVSFFMKQLGTNPVDLLGKTRGAMFPKSDRKGGHLESLPPDLQIRQFPEVTHAA